jgi:HPt (histidine-containing phosphotransfer) domain-containing protein
MSEDLEKKLLAGSAYRIFFDELQKHITATRSSFEGEGWTEDSMQEAMGRFHTIKGGAGFFKLTKLAELAGLLETAIQGDSLEELRERALELRELNYELQKVAAEIPPPAVPA